MPFSNLERLRLVVDMYVFIFCNVYDLSIKVEKSLTLKYKKTQQQFGIGKIFICNNILVLYSKVL